MRIDLPQDRGGGAVHRDDAELVIARSRVVQRVPVGVGRRRALREILGHQVGEQRLARSGIQEVVVPVVGTFADLHRPVLQGYDVGLAGPAGPAPLLDRRPRAALRGHRAHLRAVVRIDPPLHRVRRHRSLPVPRAGGVAAERGQPRDLLVRRRRRGRGREDGPVGSACDGEAHGAQQRDRCEGSRRPHRHMVARSVGIHAPHRSPGVSRNRGGSRRDRPPTDRSRGRAPSRCAAHLVQRILERRVVHTGHHIDIHQVFERLAAPGS